MRFQIFFVVLQMLSSAFALDNNKFGFGIILFLVLN